MLKNNSLQNNEYTLLANSIHEDLFLLRDRSILITGASGLIGSYFINLLLFINSYYFLNITITGVSRNKKKLEDLFGKETKNLEFLELDLNDSFSQTKKYDYIVHAASNADPISFATTPVETMKTNILGTINLLESIIGKETKLLFISSGEVYGNNINRSFCEENPNVIEAANARSCYPASKTAAEVLCMSYNKQYDTFSMIARLCYIYGATITEENSRADAQFLRNAIKQEDIVMKSQGLQRRTYCYVADAISAIIIILLKGKKSEIYNIANRNSITSVSDYAKTLAKIGNVKLRFDNPNNMEKQGFSKIGNSILDATKLEALDWQPLFDLNKGLRNTYQIKKNM